MNEFEIMEQFAYDNNIKLLTEQLPEDMSGFYYSNSEYDLKTITLNKCLCTLVDKTCTLAEEIGHFITTPVNLFYAPKAIQRKFERLAKYNATLRLMPLYKLIKASEAAVSNDYELAEYLDVTIEFLHQGLRLYHENLHDPVYYDGYRIEFLPLRIDRIASYN